MDKMEKACITAIVFVAISTIAQIVILFTSTDEARELKNKIEVQELKKKLKQLEGGD